MIVPAMTMMMRDLFGAQGARRTGMIESLIGPPALGAGRPPWAVFAVMHCVPIGSLARRDLFV